MPPLTSPHGYAADALCACAGSLSSSSASPWALGAQLASANGLPAQFSSQNGPRCAGSSSSVQHELHSVSAPYGPPPRKLAHW